MKVITEAMIRNELRSGKENEYLLSPGMLLSPAAKEYLQQRKIRIVEAGTSVQEKEEQRYTDYLTGAYYQEKPENMTHLQGNALVIKNHPRIIFRGKLDSLCAETVEFQAELALNNGSEVLIEELSDILDILRQIMRSDAVEEAYQGCLILGLSHDELREHSHNPMKYYNVRPMMLPDYKMGLTFARLNRLRTSVRETELAAVAAYQKDEEYQSLEIVEELNRLSSACHIMMCRCQAGCYK